MSRTKKRVSQSRIACGLFVGETSNTQLLSSPTIDSQFSNDGIFRTAENEGYRDVGDMIVECPDCKAMVWKGETTQKNSESVGCTSFEDIRTVKEHVYDTYREACGALQLLPDDRQFLDAIDELSVLGSGWNFVLKKASPPKSRFDYLSREPQNVMFN
ncbi:hypothetical protein TSUD_275760 [Trifolium subterraneum]|uniref:Uncharacterized protein n=1 Tax=Trifolium subterraneum TaxID=3900 RepID=A0A2Z6NHF6_TRISU|nr:hypothetical protein TSUD_275760 [Trifolium subterraneum]